MEEIQRRQDAESKVRIDQLLAKKGLAKSREKAKEWISDGLVLADGKQVEKPSELVSPDADIQILSSGQEFVSRGGKKLQGALEGFGLHVEGMICLDAGASTGGFTDCLLQHGAEKVFAVDVGSNQLDEKLRSDPRVVSIENTNIRTMDPSRIDPCGFFCADLSFISLRLVLGPIRKMLLENGQGIVLVKPQFEAGRAAIGKGGIVKDPKIHQKVLEEVITGALTAGFAVSGLLPSPIRGGDGNIEYLLLLKAKADQDPFTGNEVGSECIRETVRNAMKEKRRG